MMKGYSKGVRVARTPFGLMVRSKLSSVSNPDDGSPKIRRFHICPQPSRALRSLNFRCWLCVMTLSNK
jgi:hypothetical protein